MLLIPRRPLQSGVRYTVALTVNGTPYTWSFVVGVLGNETTCATLSMSATPPSSSPSGTQVMVSANATNCPNPRYRFWVAPPAGAWQIAQDYKRPQHVLWRSTGLAGTYRLEVDARDDCETTAREPARQSQSVQPPPRGDA